MGKAAAEALSAYAWPSKHTWLGVRVRVRVRLRVGVRVRARVRLRVRVRHGRASTPG